MKDRKTSSDKDSSDNRKKNADNKKLGDKIGPAKKNDRDEKLKEEENDDKTSRSDKNKNSR